MDRMMHLHNIDFYEQAQYISFKYEFFRLRSTITELSNFGKSDLAGISILPSALHWSDNRHRQVVGFLQQTNLGLHIS
jgi:hypothetical protein